MKNKDTCHFCGAPIGAVHFASGGKKFCGDNGKNCLAQFQDGTKPLHERNKLSWRFQEQTPSTIPAWRLKYAPPSPYD